MLRRDKTTDGGQSFTVISPDLTLNDKSHEQSSGGLTPDNLMTWDGALLFAIAESPVAKGEIWAGTNDGQVQLTRDGGATWANLTKNITGLPPWGTISNIEPSKYDAATAHISVDLQTVGNFDPFIYKTADYGRTWTLISGGIPKSESSFVHVVREDPVRKGMLYAGTDNSVYVSWDDGGSWTPLRNNMPPAPVYWLTIQPTFNDLVVATYGRGFEAEDRLTDVRLTGQVEDSFRNPMRLYGKMLAMAANLDKGNDLPPTDQEISVNELWQEELGAVRQRVAQVTGAGTAAFNDTAKAHGYSLAIRP